MTKGSQFQFRPLKFITFFFVVCHSRSGDASHVLRRLEHLYIRQTELHCWCCCRVALKYFSHIFFFFFFVHLQIFAYKFWKKIFNTRCECCSIGCLTKTDDHLKKKFNKTVFKNEVTHPQMDADGTFSILFSLAH